jgi:hypothetical protein
MFYVSVIIFPLTVALLAAGLLLWHVLSWRHLQREEEGAELDFGRRQFRRRVQTSSMLGVLAIGLCVGQLIPRQQTPTLFVLFWLGLLLLLAWIVLLALGDLIVGRQHIARLSRERRVAEAQLRAELQRLREKLATNAEDKENPA